MPGGNFNKRIGKDRPGTYINYESTNAGNIPDNDLGVVLIPLAGHGYGPHKEFITIDNTAPDAQLSKLGYSIFDDNPDMLLIREAFKRSQRVVVYIPNQGERAAATQGSLKAAARYGGARGNALRFSAAANPIKGFDATIFLDTQTMSSYERLETISDLIAQDDAWIEFSLAAPSGDSLLPLEEVAGVNLEGGTNGTLSAGDIADFFEASEGARWRTMAFPFEPSGESGDVIPGLQAALLTKIKYLREEMGRYRKAVMVKFDADYEGIVNVTNSVVLENGVKLSIAQATAWVAGADAGASNTQSNTYMAYEGAVGIVGAKGHEEAILAIRNGEFFFSMSEQGEVIAEYDINSLVTFGFPKDKTWRKNRVLRVHDSFAEAVMQEFPPNRFNNNPEEWDVMEGLGGALLMRFQDEGAIKNADYSTDFLVDREASGGESVYFNVGLQAVDSAEKLFFTIRTR